MVKIKRAVRRWLGLGESFIGVDIGVHDQSCIVVVSRFNDGSARIVEMPAPVVPTQVDVDNQMEIERLIKARQICYAVSDKGVFRDMLHAMGRRAFSNIALQYKLVSIL